jgi:hypothetical protein
MQAVGLAFGLLTAFDVERVMDVLQRAVVVPQTEIVVHRAARGQVFRNLAPLASSAQDAHHAVHHLAHVDASFAAATLGWGCQRLDMLPLRVGQITRMPQLVTVVAGAVFGRPHEAPHESAPRIESQTLQRVQATI